MGRHDGQLAALDEAAAQLGNAGPRAARQLALARSQLVAPQEGLAIARRVRDEAQADGVLSFVLEAEVRAAQAALRLGEPAQAGAHARAALQLFDEIEPFGLYRASVWLAAAQALQRADPDRAARVLRSAAAWIRDTAERRVSAEFRDSFLHRNPVNRELLALAAKLPGVPADR